MKNAASLKQMPIEQNQRISNVVNREQLRLRNFIRRYVPDPRDAEDILQDVFYELVEGRSFKAMAAETGVSVNTLLSRKRYAVRHLRERLQCIYDEFIKA